MSGVCFSCRDSSVSISVKICSVNHCPDCTHCSCTRVPCSPCSRCRYINSKHNLSSGRRETADEFNRRVNPSGSTWNPGHYAGNNSASISVVVRQPTDTIHVYPDVYQQQPVLFVHPHSMTQLQAPFLNGAGAPTRLWGPFF